MASIKKAVAKAATKVTDALPLATTNGDHPEAAKVSTPADSLASTLKNGVEHAQDGGKEVLVYLVTLQDNGNPQQGKTVSRASRILRFAAAELRVTEISEEPPPARARISPLSDL